MRLRKTKFLRVFTVGAAVAMLSGISAASAFAGPLRPTGPPAPPRAPAYNSLIPGPRDPYYQDQCFACQGITQFGNEINLANTGQLGQVVIAMRNWGPEIASLPITLNIYNPPANQVQAAAGDLGTTISSLTQSFAIPAAMPNGDPAAFNITFAFQSLNVIVPQTLVYGIVFDPTVASALNVSLSSSAKNLNVGTDTYPGTVWLNTTWQVGGADFPSCVTPDLGVFSSMVTDCGSYPLGNPGAYGTPAQVAAGSNDIPAVEFTVSPSPKQHPMPSANAGDLDFTSGNNGVTGASGSAIQVNQGHGGRGGQLTSVGYGYGLASVSFSKKATFSQLTNLATDYTLDQGVCVGGAPRFQVDLLAPGDKNLNDAVSLYVYIGVQPYGGCPTGGLEIQPNVASASSPAAWWAGPSNTSMTYTAAETQYGAYQLLDAQIAVDAGWAQAGGSSTSGTQQVVVNNLMVNNQIFFPLPH